MISDDKTWVLYGTLGCHLCDNAEQLLQQANTVKDFAWRKLDIANLPENEMLALADKIPVLKTPTKILYFPFSIMDILAIN